MRSTSIPLNPGRVILVNPTKYLGNLLLAGGLMQEYSKYCAARGIALKIILDESYRELCENSFPEGSLIYFPRKKIKEAGFLKKIALYHDCLKQVRDFKADLAFNIEEDSATSHLTRLSGATFKLGCSVNRHKWGYDHVIPVDFENRPLHERHRWYSYLEVFTALGMPRPRQSYLRLALEGFPETLKKKLSQSGWNPDIPTIAIHAGATKDYKRWPEENFTVLCGLILEASMQPVLLGAGKSDREINAAIVSQLSRQQDNDNVVDLCDRLSLRELAEFLAQCHYMIGNDSGPFHLGSALGIPGSVIFGPTNKSIWQPLGAASELIQGDFACDPACSKAYCLYDHRCLKEIPPALVFSKIPPAADH